MDVGHPDSTQDSQNQYDAIREDVIQSDTLPQDASNPCVPNPCRNGGTCSVVSGNANCICQSPFDGPTCNTCAYAYVGYPTCQPVPPTITILNVACGAGCTVNSSHVVTWNFTDATSYTAELMWESGNTGPLGTLQNTSGAQILPGTAYPLPVTTTGTQTPYSIS